MPTTIVDLFDYSITDREISNRSFRSVEEVSDRRRAMMLPEAAPLGDRYTSVQPVNRSLTKEDPYLRRASDASHRKASVMWEQAGDEVLDCRRVASAV